MDPKIIWMALLTIACLAQAIAGLSKALTAKNKRKAAEQEEETTSFNPANPNDKPGKAQICINNGLTLERLETQMTDVRDDIEKIFRRLNK